MLESKVSVEKRSLSDEEVDDQDDDDYDNSNPKKKQVIVVAYNLQQSLFEYSSWPYSQFVKYCLLFARIVIST